ncbi:MAG: hypothetical protein A49_04120 [Methyloceanibacter sp.]|nr:MAG: hypothetical protein A49_04120 [Methyloceanibacter sp.]
MRLGAEALENISRALIAGVLDDERCARLDKQPGDEVKPVLTTGDDNDLVGIDDNATGGPKVIGDRDSELFETLRVVVLRQRGVRPL